MTSGAQINHKINFGTFLIVIINLKVEVDLSLVNMAKSLQNNKTLPSTSISFLYGYKHNFVI
jgi:hypothetical protein